jgi:DNA-binding transcriptional LysR family regulator
MGMDTEDMTFFLAVAREGSFGRAASSLLVSQPSVSERIARLERNLGGTLFTRGSRGTRLTSAGEQLMPYARRVVDLFDDAAEAVRGGERPPRLRVAVHATFAHRAVPLVLDSLGQHRRRVTVRDAHSDEVIAMLLDGVADVGFVLAGARPRPLRFLSLPTDPVLALCAPSHPLAGRTVRLQALAEHRVALNRWGSGAAEFVGQLDRAGMPDWRLTECSDGHTALTLARDRGHVALVTASIAGHDLSVGTLIRLGLRPSPRWTVPLALAYRDRDHEDPVIASLRTVARMDRRQR